MEHPEFKRLVAEALDDIPEEFARHLANVTIMVADEPAPALLLALGKMFTSAEILTRASKRLKKSSKPKRYTR